MSELGERLIQGAKQARSTARGEVQPARVFTPPWSDVAAIRMRAGLSQDRFAQRYGLSVAANRDRELSRRVPDPAAGTRSIVTDREPEAVVRALATI